MYHLGLHSGGTRIFCGAIEGETCVSEGAKIQKFAKNDWFLQFFSSKGGKWGSGESLRLGENAPSCLDATIAFTGIIKF